MSGGDGIAIGADKLTAPGASAILASGEDVAHGEGTADATRKVDGVYKDGDHLTVPPLFRLSVRGGFDRDFAFNSAVILVWKAGGIPSGPGLYRASYSCPAIRAATSRSRPFRRYSVIPVPRKLWAQISAGNPTFRGRRLIILGPSPVGGEILRQARGSAFSTTRLARKQDVSPAEG